jgi:hypothetical protein
MYILKVNIFKLLRVLMSFYYKKNKNNKKKISWAKNMILL